MKICLSCEGVSNTSANRCGHCGAWLLPTDTIHYPVRRGEIDAGNPLLGTIVDGKYRLQGVLGRGGLGTVFRAQHIGSLLTVALKILHPRFSERAEYRRALLPEARRAATVTHERCARVLDVGEAEDGVAYLAMELVEGKTLDLLVRAGALAPSHALEILAQIAEALVAIHAVGLVHCDLSPRNVMVTPRGTALQVKVLDFGIARSVSLAGLARPQGEFAGFVNPAFAAPELTAGKEVDARADLYSLGTLACLLLTGTMPVDDADPRRAAAAVAAGDLRPWSLGTTLPRRLVRLVQRCLMHSPAQRPASAAVVGRELAILRGARRPALARASVAVLGIGVLAVLAGGRSASRPFLRPLSGSVFELVDGSLSATQPSRDLHSRSLETLRFDYGGFTAARLRADLVRDGDVLLRKNLSPEVDAAAGTLLLSTAQAEWREVVQSLARTSHERPIDLVFVVPGSAALGSARLRLDDTPPTLTGDVIDGEGGLTQRTKLRYHATDAVGVRAVAAQVHFATGRTVELELPAGATEFALGDELAAKTNSLAALGAGTLVLAAADRAGNRHQLPAVAFAAADVAAPRVVEVSGPIGEGFLPAASGRVRMRIRLSGAEAGCTLAVARDGEFAPAVQLVGAAEVHTVEMDLGGDVHGGLWKFAIEDAAGNRTLRDLPIVVHDRSLRVDFDCVDANARSLGGELVLGDRPCRIEARVGANWSIGDVRVDLSASSVGKASDSLLRWERGPGSFATLHLGALPPGSHTLRFELHEADGDGEPRLRTATTVPLRVLPAAIDVRVPTARSRFLPGLLQAGVLARSGEGVVEGVAWRMDPTLRGYLRGTLWVGVATPVPLPLSARHESALLPAVVPVVGRNRLAIEMSDVLQRPVRLWVGDELVVAADQAALARVTVADFWWHDEVPTLIGEELLVEFGQLARVKLRCPWPLQAEDAEELRLDIGQSEVPVGKITPMAGDASTIVFDVPFLVWSAAAKLADKTRDQYSAQLEARVPVHVATPSGRYPLSLRLRTMRSTLLPVTLGELSDVPAELAGLRLLPVLAPSLPFPEPVPPLAPPRATFRPQVAVAVRNMTDILLQDRELTCGQARALVTALPRVAAEDLARCVHHDDPLAAARMTAVNLLPKAVALATSETTLTEVTFYQAWALTRLLGLVVANDVDAFRLPLGCELELATFGGASVASCNGPVAHGGAVSMAAFLAATHTAASGEPKTAQQCETAGDVVGTSYGAAFFGLDFGVREWVLDIPHVLGADGLLREWIADRDAHLMHIDELSRGVANPMPDRLGPLRHLGVVRGLGLGQRQGLIDATGRPLDVAAFTVVPGCVPGVLRTEQLRRDGIDLLAGSSDPRLQCIGFRVVGVKERLIGLRGPR